MKDVGQQARRKVKARIPIAERSYLFTDEAARELGCSTVTVDRLANGSIQGYLRLPFLPRGKRRRVFRKVTLEAWMRMVETMPGHANIGTSNSTAGRS